MFKFDYLVPSQKSKRSQSDCWANRLIKKHFDLPEYTGVSFLHTEIGELWLDRGIVVKRMQLRVPFDCCGVHELSAFSQNRVIIMRNLSTVDLLPFWEEYWPQFRLHCPIPVMFILARTKFGDPSISQRYVSPNNEIMAKNSIKISSFRNIRYPDHILDVHLMWHPDGTELLTDVNTEWRESIVFPESFEP